MKVTSPVADKIYERIESFDTPSVFFISNFIDIATPDVTRKILQQFIDKSLIHKAANGIYYKPKESRYGMIQPSLDDIAYAIAKRDKVDIMPTGSTAMNKLGLSTQVPMNAVYLTTGTARVVDISGRKINFRHSKPLNFAYKTQLVALMVQALKEIGKDNLDEEQTSRLSVILEKHIDDESVREDILLAPQWMQALFRQLTGKIKHATLAETQRD